MIHKTKEILKSVVPTFSDAKVRVVDLTRKSIGVIAEFDSTFFLEYTADAKGEDVPLSKTLLDEFGYDFGAKKITVETNDVNGKRHIIIKGKETLKDPLLDQERPIYKKLGTKRTKELGIVPLRRSKDSEKFEPFSPNIQVLINSNELSSLPPAENYIFESDGKKIKVSWRTASEGVRSRPLTLAKQNILKEFRKIYDGDFLPNIVANLEGDVWLSIDERAAIFHQSKKDYVLTYILASRQED